MSQTASQVTLDGESPENQTDAADSVDEDQASLFEASGESKDETDSDQGTQSETGSEYPPAGNEGSRSSAGEESLEKFGVEEDNSPNNGRLDNPDGNLEQDRRTNRRRDGDDTTQEQLFPDVDDENQLTLGGARAYNQCNFE